MRKYTKHDVFNGYSHFDPSFSSKFKFKFWIHQQTNKLSFLHFQSWAIVWGKSLKKQSGVDNSKVLFYSGKRKCLPRMWNLLLKKMSREGAVWWPWSVPFPPILRAGTCSAAAAGWRWACRWPSRDSDRGAEKKTPDSASHGRVPGKKRKLVKKLIPLGSIEWLNGNNKQYIGVVLLRKKSKYISIKTQLLWLKTELLFNFTF